MKLYFRFFIYFDRKCTSQYEGVPYEILATTTGWSSAISSNDRWMRSHNLLRLLTKLSYCFPRIKIKRWCFTYIQEFIINYSMFSKVCKSVSLIHVQVVRHFELINCMHKTCMWLKQVLALICTELYFIFLPYIVFSKRINEIICDNRQWWFFWRKKYHLLSNNIKYCHIMLT